MAPSLTKRRRLRYCASKSVQSFRLYPCQRAWKVKKSTHPYMLRICTSVPENFSETKFCLIIQVDNVINRAKYFFNRFTRVSLARGQTSPFPVQTVDGHYNWCTTVQLWLPPSLRKKVWLILLRISISGLRIDGNSFLFWILMQYCQYSTAKKVDPYGILFVFHSWNSMVEVS